MLLASDASEAQAAKVFAASPMTVRTFEGHQYVIFPARSKATTYKFADNQYVFTFREFLIPVASVFFYNFDTMRSTGKFLGITADGRVENSKAGARIRKVSMTYYLPGEEPV